MTPPKDGHEAEWKTRKQRIDPKLDACGWSADNKAPAHRTEEEETDHGPADYVLWLDGRIVAVIEAKKLTVGPQNVLTQAERYARAIRNSPFNFDGKRVPFLYSTNGEVIWFHDVRHPLNRSRRVADFHTPDALREMLDTDFEARCSDLLATPNASTVLRSYQRDANTGVERAIAERKRNLLVAMATGTGKTFTLVNQVYRLMKSGVARRVLFLVDRRALAAQGVRAFSYFDAEPGQKFDQIYEVYSNKFQREDFDENDKFDPKEIKESYLTRPKPKHAFVYVATIQRMALYVLGEEARKSFGPEFFGEEDGGALDIPIHAFDVVVADECHRGYTSGEESVWRKTLDHFDAIKIGLTATPAAHTAAYFQHLAYRYDYQDAVKDGHLVDYEVVEVDSKIRMTGLFLKEGEQVERIDPGSGMTQLDLLEDERQFEATEIESKITAPDSNRKIIEAVRDKALAHEQEHHRFPKILIFAANDRPHTSHADQLVNICRDVFGRGESFVQKITGTVDRPLQRIREFRNRKEPGIAVTVDLLSTGVDIPDLEFIVFLRPVKSRILFTQMLGRGTRMGFYHPDKSHFVVFDCFGGSLLEYFRKATDITVELPAPPTRTVPELIDAIWNNKERAYNVGCLVKRLHRIDKAMSGKGRDEFAAFIPDGDVAGFARALGKMLDDKFVETMKLLRSEGFQDLLVNYPRPKPVFYIAHGAEDEVESRWVFRDSSGVEYQPEDYLSAFARFVKENPAEIEAIRILLDRPRNWSSEALDELRKSLGQSKYRFTEDNLRKAHHAKYQRALVDIISMVKHAADEQSPLLSAAERAEAAFAKVTTGKTFSPDQTRWLDRIRTYMVESLSISRDDFDVIPIFSRDGGLAAARKVFGDRFDSILSDLNEAIAA